MTKLKFDLGNSILSNMTKRGSWSWNAYARGYVLPPVNQSQCRVTIIGIRHLF